MQQRKIVKFSTLIISVLLVALIMSVTALATSNETPVLYVKDRLAQAGETVSVEVCIEGNPGITNATLTLTYSEGLTIQSIDQGSVLASHEFSQSSEAGSNTTTYTWQGTQADATNGTILTFAVNVPANAEAGTVYELNAEFTTDNGTFDVFDGFIEVVDYVPGDVDGNEEVNGDDVTALRQYIVGGHNVTIDTRAADVNDDGRLNGDDVTLIRQALTGGYGVTLLPTTKCLNHTLTNVAAKAPTCTEAGNIEYWQCENCNRYYRDANGVKAISLERTVIAALGHALTKTDAVAATCTEAGNSAYWTCSTCNKYFSDAEGETEIEKDSWIIAATDHDWSVEYAWTLNDGVWVCTATRTCANSEACTMTATATITSAVKTPATGDKNGTTTYTATFDDADWAETQTKDVDDIPAYGYTDPTIAIENVVVDGDLVTFDVAIRNNPGVMNMLLSMNVNNDVFEFVSATKGDALPSGTLTASGEATTESPYKFLLDGMALTDADAADGVIFTVTLRIKNADATGEFDINFSYVPGDISNGNLEAVEMNIKNGKVVLG